MLLVDLKRFQLTFQYSSQIHLIHLILIKTQNNQQNIIKYVSVLLNVIISPKK